MTVPPPTPKRALKAPAAVAIAARRTSREDTRAYYGGCLLAPQKLSPRPAPAHRRPGAGRRPLRRGRDARADRGPGRGRRVPRGGAVCSAGWPAATGSWPASPAARRPRRGGWWGSAAIAYAGSHGAELLEPGASPRPDPGVAGAGRGGAIRSSRRARHSASCACCACGSRTRARSSPSTGAACPTRRPRGRGSTRWLAEEAEADGLDPLGAQGARDPAAGRRSARARRCATWCRGAGAQRGALRGRRRHRPRRLRGARRARPREGALETAVRVGVRSDEGPRDRGARATWWWTACTGSPVLAALAG